MSFDIRTALLLSFLINMLLASVIALVTRHYPHPINHSLGLWSRGILMQSLGWLGLGLRDHIPVLLSIFIGNGLVFIGTLQITHALRVFLGRKDWRRMLTISGALMIGSVMWFAVVTPNYQYRLMTLQVSGLVLSMFTWVSLAFPRQRGRSDNQWILLGVFTVGVAVFAIRVGYELFVPHAPLKLFESHWSQTMVFSYTLLAPIVTTFGMLLMCNDRFVSELDRMASHDALTGVANRRHIETIGWPLFVESSRTKARLSVLLIDIDHFKQVNDRHGHLVGDDVLRAIAHRLQADVQNDEHFGRFGGEEFVAVMPGLSETEACARAERWRARIANEPVRIGGMELSVRVSIGVAEKIAADADWLDLLQRADRALYAAKQNGRNCCVKASTLEPGDHSVKANQ